MASQKVSAKVEFITGLKTGEFGEYRSVLFPRDDSEGEAAKVWRSFQLYEVSVFSKGQQVYLIPAERKGKTTWDVELVEDEAIAARITGLDGVVMSRWAAIVARARLLVQI